MKKLLLILMLTLFSLLGQSETRDTTRLPIHLIQKSFGECLITSLETGQFENISKNLQYRVVLIVQGKDSVTTIALDKYEVIDFLNSLLDGLYGQAKIYIKDSTYLVTLEAPELEHPIYIMFGVDEVGLVYKVFVGRK